MIENELKILNELNEQIMMQDLGIENENKNPNRNNPNDTNQYNKNKLN